MSHARQQIRDAVATLLTGLTTTGTSVYTSRVYPVETVPSLAVYTLSENVSDVEFDGTQTRELILAVEARVKTATSFDDQIDTICAEVETALIADQYLSALSLPIKLLELTETNIEISDDLEQPAGIATMIFAIHYRVDESDPTTLVD